MPETDGLPSWIGDIPDPERPPWRALPLWQRSVVLLGLVLSALLAIVGTIALTGLAIRLFRWAAWGVGCGCLLLALTAPAAAEWILGTLVCLDDRPPRCTAVKFLPGPMPLPPVTPPGPPVVPPVVPPVDPSPFVFPTDCPRYPYRGDQDRYYAVGEIGGDFGTFYAAELDAGNPSQSADTCMGVIQAGPHAGKRLWGPRRAPSAIIRCVLALGRVCP